MGLRRVAVRFIFAGWLAAVGTAGAAQVPVNTAAALQSAIDKANPGDTVVVAEGIYSPTSAIKVARAGTAEKPIVITAAAVGAVEMKGSGGFSIVSPSQHVVIRGFKLTHQAGIDKVEAGAHHCRFTRNLFQCTGTGEYLQLNGDDNEVDYNTFQHKSTEYQMIMVLGPSGTAMAKRNWIHHNFFNDFRNTNANNSAAIEVGYSSRSMDSSFTLMEYNLFLDCRGENEGAICVKSSNAIVRYNTVGKGSTEIPSATATTARSTATS